MGEIFYIKKGDQKIQANILTNFELYGDHYCIYTTKKDNDANNVYCAKLINNELIEITDENEKKRVDTIIKELLNK